VDGLSSKEILILESIVSTMRAAGDHIAVLLLELQELTVTVHKRMWGVE
jgi:hypothetical protein